MNKNKAIGGYFELELSGSGNEYYTSLYRLNTARNAIVYVLQKRKCSKVYLPHYTCGVLIDAIKKVDISISFYAINKHLEIEKIPVLRDGELLIYTNYFGLKDNYIKHLTATIPNIIIDNAQAFFSKPLPGVDTVYCARKFFGVPDGAYLSTDLVLDEELEVDVSVNRMSHLLKRLETGAESGFEDFKLNDNALKNEPLKRMSNLTLTILSKGVDYQEAAMQRALNFQFLHEHLKLKNNLDFSIEKGISPMVYPYMASSSKLKEFLITNRIFVATYWPDVLERTPKSSLEYFYTTNLVALPIDHRYNEEDMNRIVEIIELYGE